MNSYTAFTPGARSRFACGVANSAVLWLIALVLTPVCWGQSDALKDVHVRPRTPALEAPTFPAPVNPAPPLNETDRSLRARVRAFVKDVSLVLVPVTVTDPWNRLVMGLRRDNFTILEDEQSQEIRHFSSEDSPVSLCVIFDISESMKNKINQARDAVEEFVLSSNPQDEFCLITFSDRPNFLVDFTEPVDNLLLKLNNVIPEGHTAMLDAIYLGVDEMRQARNPRKVLLIISDGDDNRSRYNAREISDLVMESDIQVYSIGIFEGFYLLSSPETARGPRLLRKVANASGGNAVTITDIKKLDETARNLNLQMRNQYVLGYQPQDPSHNGKWRTIKVRVTPPQGSPSLHVAAKDGYYAPGK